MCFSDAAARLAGIAGAVVGWRPCEFWTATPAELAAVLAALAGDREPPVDLPALLERFPDG